MISAHHRAYKRLYLLLRCAGFFLVALIAPHSLAGDITSNMVRIPAGTYTPFFLSPPAKIENVINLAKQNRSDLVNKDKTIELKPHERVVKIKSFLLDRYPVTFREFSEFVARHPMWSKADIIPLFSDDNYLRNDFEPNSPVTNVSWFAAQAYCEFLGKTLPTTNQFEYVFSNNNIDKERINEKIISWYSKPQSGERKLFVGLSEPNSYGVYDLYALIWEWTFDFNSIIVAGGDSRDIGSNNTGLFCGAGALNSLDPTDYASFIRFALRTSLKAHYSINNLGFRCAKN